MKPRERRETGAMDLFRSRLDQIINMSHELVRLAKTVSWEAIEARCGEEFFRHELPFGRSSMTRWRGRPVSTSASPMRGPASSP